jgi:hypothetical protein
MRRVRSLYEEMDLVAVRFQRRPVDGAFNMPLTIIVGGHGQRVSQISF